MREGFIELRRGKVPLLTTLLTTTQLKLPICDQEIDWEVVETIAIVTLCSDSDPAFFRATHRAGILWLTGARKQVQFVRQHLVKTA